MDKPNRKTNNLLDGLAFLKENGVDLDVFYNIEMSSNHDRITMQGYNRSIVPMIPLFESVGFRYSQVEGAMLLETGAGSIEIIMDVI